MSNINFWSNNTGINFRRKSTRRHRHNLSSDRTSTPVTLRPSVDTSTGIIAIRYPSSEHSPSSHPSMPQSSGSSERSFYTEGSLTSEDSGSEQAATRPSLPKRSASRRVAFRPTSSPMTAAVEQDRPTTPTLTAADVESRPPIPPKSPYRASRAMVRLQGEMAVMSEDQANPLDRQIVHELEG